MVVGSGWVFMFLCSFGAGLIGDIVFIEASIEPSVLKRPDEEERTTTEEASPPFSFTRPHPLAPLPFGHNTAKSDN